MRVGSIVIDCREFDRMFEFWGAALGYVPREAPTPGWVVLTDPKGRGPNLSLNRVDEDLPVGSRLHIDLYTRDQSSEVARLRGLGARLHRTPEPGEDFVVLADPDGNLFCVVGKPTE
jgi:catechol 2,3-dioxygenase-like lactoylglutathione lyase family enzyme